MCDILQSMIAALYGVGGVIFSGDIHQYTICCPSWLGTKVYFTVSTELLCFKAKSWISRPGEWEQQSGHKSPAYKAVHTDNHRKEQLVFSWKLVMYSFNASYKGRHAIYSRLEAVLNSCNSWQEEPKRRNRCPSICYHLPYNSPNSQLLVHNTMTCCITIVLEGRNIACCTIVFGINPMHVLSLNKLHTIASTDAK